VLHYRHELNGVVTQLLDTREDIAREFCVSSDAVFARRDPDMSLVDARALWGWRRRVLELVTLFLGGIPEPGVVCGREVEILSNPTDPSGQSLDAFPGRRDHRDLRDVKTGSQTQDRTKLALILES